MQLKIRHILLYFKIWDILFYFKIRKIRDILLYFKLGDILLYFKIIYFLLIISKLVIFIHFEMGAIAEAIHVSINVNECLAVC